MANDFTPDLMRGKTRADVRAQTKAGDRVYDLRQLQNTRTQFNDKSQYNIVNASYPIDLLSNTKGGSSNSPNVGSTEYGGNYVVFYINVSDSSKIIRNQDSIYSDRVVEDWTPRDKTRLAGQNITKGQAEVGSTVEAAVVSGALTNFDYKKAAGLTATNFIGVEAIGTQSPKFSKQMKRLSTAIALHTPNNLVARYSANYDDVNTSAFQMAMRGGEDLARAVTQGFKNGNIDSEVSDDVKTIGAAIALNTVAGKDSISAITGIAVNPKREQVFRGVDFRTWSFDYQFFPRSQQEYQNIENIIYLFKLHMHPEYKDANNFLYLYPSEFDIVHYTGTDENLHLPRHTSCVLTDFTVNYAPQSQFTAFEGGVPTQINIQMTFKELVQMSKERIQEGY